MLRLEFGQSRDVEVIVVDDGSRDHTAELVEAHLRGWAGAKLVKASPGTRARAAP